MPTQNMSGTKKIALSGIIVALYVVIMYFTASFAFGAYQIRIATALYALSYFFPFLVLPLALANMLSNILSMQIWDIVGGFFIGLLTSGAIAALRTIKSKHGALVIIPIIIAFPGLIVPIWLSYILNLPYWTLAASLIIGQIVPAVTGYFIVSVIMPRITSAKRYFPKKSKQKDESGKYLLSDENYTAESAFNSPDEISGITPHRTFDDEVDESGTTDIED